MITSHHTWETGVLSLLYSHAVHEPSGRVSDATTDGIGPVE